MAQTCRQIISPFQSCRVTICNVKKVQIINLQDGPQGSLVYTVRKPAIQSSLIA